MRSEKPHILAGSALRFGASSLSGVEDAPASSTSSAVAGLIFISIAEEGEGFDEECDEEFEITPPLLLLLLLLLPPLLLPRARRSEVDDEPLEARLPNRPMQRAPRTRPELWLPTDTGARECDRAEGRHSLFAEKSTSVLRVNF
jgi:hypothetical protein